MKKRKKDQDKRQTKDKPQEIFQMINPNAAGIDIGSEEHWVAVPEDRDEQPIRKFGCLFLSRLAKEMQYRKRSYGINGRLLDPPFSDSGKARLRS